MHFKMVSRRKSRCSDCVRGAIYFFLCLLACMLVSSTAIVLWSSMGWGVDGLALLAEHDDLVLPCAAASVTLLFILYLLDFFCPPHLPGRYMALFKNDYCIGRAMLGIASMAFISACLLSARRFPSIPLTITLFVSPILTMGIRAVCRDKDPHAWVDSLDRLNDVQLTDQMMLMDLLVGQERDTRSFYLAASGAFALTALACLAAWTVWTSTSQSPGLGLPKLADDVIGPNDRAVEALYICWAAPLIASLVHLMFAFVVFFRYSVSRSYDATDELKNELEILMGRSTDGMPSESSTVSDIDADSARQRYLDQKQRCMRQLSTLVKTVGCALIFMLGVFYIAAELVAADSHIAQMVQGFLGAFFLAFLSVVMYSLRRLLREMKDWFKLLPLWRMTLKLLKWEWTRAVLLCIILPLIPVVLTLSALNQKVRVWRKLYQKIQPMEEAEGKKPHLERSHSELSSVSWLTGLSVNGPPEEHLLTLRVRRQITVLGRWDWISLTQKIYIVGGLFILYTITPRLLNVFLSWLGSMLQGLPFAVIVILLFGIGIVCFLLPPVPGVSVYLFIGVVGAQTCPYEFWSGVMLCIAMCWVLKLTACAVQQKLIGEKLGSNVWVKQQVGVHKPVIRAIEAVLRAPGWTMGKVAILCGGPDWPTSVGAGLLHLSVLQMEIGTLPIIFFVAPCTMCGSFYIRRDESELWNRSANLMIAFTMFVNMILWVGAAWAVQDKLDQQHAELTRPLEQHLELDWLDFREGEITKRCRIIWEDVPRCMRAAYAAGAVAVVSVGQAFYWRSSVCFGNFAVTDDIKELKWLGNDALCRPFGFLGLLIATVSGCGLTAFQRWCWSKQSGPAEEVHRELGAMEAAWKEQRLQEARAAAAR